MALISRLLPVASQCFPKLSSRILASSGYTLDLDKFGGPDAFRVWDDATAQRQDRAWQPIVAAAKAGRRRGDVESLRRALTFLATEQTTVLEVGCGGGYNSEIIAALFLGFRYTGVDLSEAMIESARKHYPQRDFAVGSAYGLAFDDHSFDIVIDGVALIHMPKWKTALGEYSRVTRGHVVLYGLTLTDDSPTTMFAKYAYGQPAMELVFARQELLEECEAVGLELVSVHPALDYNLKSYIGVESVSETWVLKAHPGRITG